MVALEIREDHYDFHNHKPIAIRLIDPKNVLPELKIAAWLAVSLKSLNEGGKQVYFRDFTPQWPKNFTHSIRYYEIDHKKQKVIETFRSGDSFEVEMLIDRARCFLLISCSEIESIQKIINQYYQ